MALQSDQEFAPSEIARAVFPTAFRGYDQDAVRRYLSRLASALEHQQEYAGLGQLEARTPVHERVDELEDEIVALQEEIRDLELELVQRSLDEKAAETNDGAVDAVVAPPVDTGFDEHRAIELLGQETARVLESARSAAADILKRAETQATALKEQAKAELSEARATAEALVVERKAESEELAIQLATDAETTAQRITAEAEEHRATVLDESNKIIADAHAQAEGAEAQAEERARQTVADAETLRQQVVAELVSERRGTQAEIDQMTSARDRLALSLAVARSELDELSDALSDIVVPVRPSAVAAISAEAELLGDSQASATEAEVGADASEVDKIIAKLTEQPPSAEAEPATPVPDDSGSGESVTVEPVEPADPVKTNKPGRKPGGKRSKSKAKNRSAAPKPLVVAADNEDTALFERPAPISAEAEPTVAQAEAQDLGVFGAVDSSDDTLTFQADFGLDEESDADPADPASNADDPADDAGGSLVDGFTTIELNEIDLTGEAAKNPEADSGGGGVEGAPDDGQLVGASIGPEPRSLDEVITTVVSRTATSQPDRTRGDLLIDEPFTGRLPKEFAARDLTLTRCGPNFRRHLRRALNDDQSDVLDRLRAGRGEIKVDELPGFGEQIDRYLAPLRRGLAEVAQAGSKVGKQRDLDNAALDNLVRQLAKFIVDKVRLPTIEVLEHTTDQDRERILEPVRGLYRDFRNVGLPDLADDALYEAFAIGLYDSIQPDAAIRWVVDPRSDPDPICEINRDRHDLVKGQAFPSGHARPLSLPGCRCLVTTATP